jgi:hypothetical protein
MQLVLGWWYQAAAGVGCCSSSCCCCLVGVDVEEFLRLVIAAVSVEGLLRVALYARCSGILCGVWGSVAASYWSRCCSGWTLPAAAAAG